MKKTLALILAAGMALSMAACGSTPTTSQAESTAESNSTSTSQAEAGKTYTVGICQLVQHVALDAATQGFEDALTEKLGDSVTFDYQDANGDSATAATICNGFVSSNVDLILANATAPLQAAAAATNTIPVLGTSITDYATALDIDDWSGVTGTNISGTSDLAPLDEQANMMAELFPADSYANIGILYCSAEANSKYQADKMTALLEAAGYTVQSFTFSDSNDVASVTQAACDASDVLYVPTDNTAAANTEAINNVALPAKTPILAGEEGICAGCGVATLSISYYDIGRVTGEMAYDILVNGADVSTMEVKFAPQVTKEYNASICEQLGVTIPEGYTAIAE